MKTLICFSEGEKEEKITQTKCPGFLTWPSGVLVGDLKTHTHPTTWVPSRVRKW